MKNNKSGYFLPYMLFIFFLLLNIVIFVVLCNLSTNKMYVDRDKYYHVFIFEERAKRHIREMITLNKVKNNDTELIYFEDEFIYLTYQYDTNENIWKVNYRIKYQEIDEYGIIIYDLETKEITIEIK